MTRLAARLNSAESDHDRVRRLAASRWADWEGARRVQGMAPNPDGSAETRRQLVREAEELAFTRVGFAGQSLKKAILDQYHRLKDHDAPDRQGGALKALAQSLDELAALMADIEDLTTPVNRVPAGPPPTGLDQFLPSAAHAASFRQLADQQRALRRRIARVSEEALRLTRPAKTNRITALEKDQRELAAAITALARQLERDKDDAAKVVLDAAVHATLAADGLAIGMLGPANGSAEKANEGLRRAATLGGTKPWVTTAADLAVRQESGRSRMVERVAPGEIAAQQKARGEDLARRAGTLANQLEMASRTTGLPDLAAAAKEAASVEAVIAEATRMEADQKLAVAGLLRAEAAGRRRRARRRWPLVLAMPAARTAIPRRSGPPRRSAAPMPPCARRWSRSNRMPTGPRRERPCARRPRRCPWRPGRAGSCSVSRSGLLLLGLRSVEVTILAATTDATAAAPGDEDEEHEPTKDHQNPPARHASSPIRTLREL